jgi:hypothetical protein
MLSSVVNNLQVQDVPTVLWKETFQIFFRLHNVLAIGQSPSLREPMDVSVDRKGRMAERLAHHHARRLVAHAG